MVNGQTFFNLNKNYDHIFSKSLTRKMLDLYDLRKFYVQKFTIQNNVNQFYGIMNYISYTKEMNNNKTLSDMRID